MKEVRIIAYCDGERHEGAMEPAVVERTVSVDGSHPVVLDLCQSCDSIFNLMLALMDRGAVEHSTSGKKAGRKPSAKAQSVVSAVPETPTACPECGHVSPNRTALGQHTRARHGKGLKDYRVAS